MNQVVLSRESLENTDLPDYAGIGLANITLVATPALAREAGDALMAADVIGFDTESKPTFLKGEVSTGPHLIQLATDQRAYLFPVARLASTDVLKAVLESSLVLKAGFGLGNDFSALKSRLGIEVKHVIDLGEVLRGPGHKVPLVPRWPLRIISLSACRNRKKSAPATGPTLISMSGSCFMPPTMPTWR